MNLVYDLKHYMLLSLLCASIIFLPNVVHSEATEKSYSIISDEAQSSILNRRKVNIRLQGKVSEKQIREIALEVIGTESRDKIVYVFYYLPLMEVGSGAWARSHFTPDLEVKIMGSKNDPQIIQHKGNIIGVWIEDTSAFTTQNTLIYDEDKKIFMLLNYDDGSSSRIEVKHSKISNNDKYSIIGSRFDEFYLVDKNNNMSLHDEEGLIHKSFRYLQQ